MKSAQIQKLKLEQSQIKTILQDFRKIKERCTDLSQKLGEEMSMCVHYAHIQRLAIRKVEVLDLTGLVTLKNQLVKALTDLFDLEHELANRNARNQNRRKLMENNEVSRKFIESGEELPTSKIYIEVPRNRKQTNFDVPIYRSKSESNENKLDRISKYVAALKKNMKANSEVNKQKWRIKEFLMRDPCYLNLLETVERYQMFEEELPRLIKESVKGKVNDFLKNSQVVQSNEEYQVIRIKKTMLTNSAVKPKIVSPVKSKEVELEKKLTKNYTLSIFSPVKDWKVSPSKFDLDESIKTELKNLEIELQKPNADYNILVERINDTIDRGERRLASLRNKRKSLFEGASDIWEALDAL